MSESELTLTEHLTELRDRLVKAAIAVVIGFVAGWVFRDELFAIVSAPVREGLANHGIYELTAIEVTETIFVFLKLALLGGLLLASPVIFYQIWSFVAPGLHSHEKRFITPIALFSVVFFLLGVLFCHRVLLPFVTDFLTGMSLGHPNIGMQVTVQSAFSFSVTLLLVFGVAFELPLFLFFLSLIGIVNTTKLWKGFRYFVLLSFVVGALFTPPDPISQVMMAVPLNLLYLVGLLLSVFAGRRAPDGKRATLPLGAWIGVAAILATFAGGIGYAAHYFGRNPTLLDHVPASARLVAGARWADAQSRPLVADVVTAWQEVEPAAAQVACVLEPLGLTADAVRSPEEIVFFSSFDDGAALLVSDSTDAGERLRAVASACPDWTTAENASQPTVRTTDQRLSVSVLADGVLVLGGPGGVAAARRATDGPTALSAVGHRAEAVARERRAGPLWGVLFSDPLAASPLADVPLGAWDTPLGSFNVGGEGEVLVNGRLRARSAQLASAWAQRLSRWTDAMLLAEAQRRRELAQAEAERRLADRLVRLAGAIEQTLASLPAPSGGADPAVARLRREARSTVVAVREELADRSSASTNQGADAAVAPSVLDPGEVVQLVASAEARWVDVQLRLRPGGLAALARTVIAAVVHGLPDDFPEDLGAVGQVAGTAAQRAAAP